MSDLIPDPMTPRDGHQALERSRRVSLRWDIRKKRALVINVDEYAAATRELNAEQSGALLLLMMFYTRSGMLPRADFQLATIAKVRSFRRFREKIWPAISKFVTEGPDDPVMPLVDAWHHEIMAPQSVRLDVPSAEWQRLRSIVFQRDQFVCQYCGLEELVEPHCDHVTPRSQGGLSTLENLVTACRKCNVSKGALTPEEWRLMRADPAGRS